jgi:carnitine O-acetyltransferase
MAKVSGRVPRRSLVGNPQTTEIYHAVVPDGYGLSYSIGNNYIRWTITSLKRNSAELRHYLAEAATETREMMERAAKAEATKTDGKAKL